MTSTQQILLNQIASEIEAEGNNLDRFAFGCQMAIRFVRRKKKSKNVKLALPDNSIEQRRTAFYQSLAKMLSDKYPSAMLRAFFDYWTEIGEGQKKMRFEKQDTFEISKRLDRWKKKEVAPKNVVNQTPERTTSSPFRNLDRFNQPPT
jgi:hypothetical protein